MWRGWESECVCGGCGVEFVGDATDFIDHFGGVELFSCVQFFGYSFELFDDYFEASF